MCDEPAPRQKIPKDGFGPRGAPDCYYTSRVLNSTFRYSRFVRKLRAEEEEQRKGAENKAKEMKDQQINDFFLRSDRRSLINDVARRVDLCMASYQEDLNKKRDILKDLFAREEEENIRKLVEQAQAGAEAVWQEKKNRLQYLLDKRKKEHEEKYKDTPLSKCVHVLPCIYKMRAKEAQEVQLYQMKEKQARKMAEMEFDKMWHEVAMKEADALTARMEYDAIERFRKDRECKEYSDYQLEQRRIQREKEREMLKQETLRFMSMWEEDKRKEEEDEQMRKEKTIEIAEERKKMIEEKQEMLAKQQAEEKLVSDAWDSLAGQGLADEKAMIELRKRKEKELDECNKKLIELKKQMTEMEAQDDVYRREQAQRSQDVMDRTRCEYLKWSRRTNEEVRQAMKDQIIERQQAKELLKKKMAEENEYYRQLSEQLKQLAEHKKKVDAEAKKQHQRNLLEQMEYNNLLKERARQEELDQIKKYRIATEEYEQEMNKMLCRPFFSEEVHPFMKQMAKRLKMKEKCPCSKSDYCK
ncbi:unnamed protein product [Parnassius mnemosyne]|uniref:Trichohyalin-plectin-homology domain-containing protein n=1 Tax=Parnassius mnemosyne TaxID=213953 RepID=A0AAV1L487_9NEOP